MGRILNEYIRGLLEEKMNEKYLRQLSKQFPNRAAVATEIVNLSAILNLPKGTEHYMTDIHGEYEQFTHVLRNGSGAVRRKMMKYLGMSLLIRIRDSLQHLFIILKRR